MTEASEESKTESSEEFGQLLKFTLAGYLGGLTLGASLDYFGLSRSGIGQWLVRTLSGEGESLFEGAYALRKRLLGARAAMAEAYGWGKLLGMTFPWLVDAISRVLQVDVYGIEGFYIPFFYAMSDQMGANISGFLFLRKRAPSWRIAFGSYITHPVMLTGLVVILGVPIGLAVARIAGFSPSTLVLTALETTVANLCWLPPLIGWLAERKRQEA